MSEKILLKLDPFLKRKIEVVAMKQKMSFEEAIIFLAEKVITPIRRDVSRKKFFFAAEVITPMPRADRCAGAAKAKAI